MRPVVFVSAFVLGAGVSWACGDDDSSASCPVGGGGCACTTGGGCDPGLRCVDGVCLPADAGTTGGGTSEGEPSSTSMATSSPVSTSDAETVSTDESDDGGFKLDVGADTEFGPGTGCRAIDMLFVLDGSASMDAERNALAATNTFAQIVTTLAGLNGGDIDYRIGLTDDDDNGFVVPGGWVGADPWFDSETMTTAEIATAFHGAVAQLGLFGGADLGCEHVLTSGTHLLDSDGSGFLRDDALLVLVLLTDVDDYGAYDQIGGHSCGAIGCSTPPPPLQGLLDTLVVLKNGQTEGVAAIVIAGDPSVNGGSNFCDQPASCGCTDLGGGLVDCEIFHATRLYQFAGMLGDNGYTSNLCAGTASVPIAVETALTESIDLACQGFEPAG
jgi:hypothetical protein